MAGPFFLRNDIGDQLVFEHRDLVAETELALLEPRDLELVRAGCGDERIDGRVKIAVLQAKQLNSPGNLFIVHPPRLPPGLRTHLIAKPTTAHRIALFWGGQAI